MVVWEPLCITTTVCAEGTGKDTTLQRSRLPASKSSLQSQWQFKCGKSPICGIYTTLVRYVAHGGVEDPCDLPKIVATSNVGMPSYKQKLYLFSAPPQPTFTG